MPQLLPGVPLIDDDFDCSAITFDSIMEYGVLERDGGFRSDAG